MGKFRDFPGLFLWTSFQGSHQQPSQQMLKFYHDKQPERDKKKLENHGEILRRGNDLI